MNQAHICLLPKGRQGLDDPSNYRPISLMNLWAKMLDKLLNQDISKHLELHNKLSDEQAGFRKGRS